MRPSAVAGLVLGLVVVCGCGDDGPEEAVPEPEPTSTTSSSSGPSAEEVPDVAAGCVLAESWASADPADRAGVRESILDAEESSSQGGTHTDYVWSTLRTLAEASGDDLEAELDALLTYCRNGGEGGVPAVGGTATTTPP